MAAGRAAGTTKSLRIGNGTRPAFRTTGTQSRGRTYHAGCIRERCPKHPCRGSKTPCSSKHSCGNRRSLKTLRWPPTKTGWQRATATTAPKTPASSNCGSVSHGLTCEKPFLQASARSRCHSTTPTRCRGTTPFSTAPATTATPPSARPLRLAITCPT